MSRRASVGVVALVSLFLLPSCGEDASNQEEIFIASGHMDWSPIMYRGEEGGTEDQRNGNAILGAGPALAIRVLKELDLNLESRYVGPWDVVQEKAESGEIDMIVAAYKTDEREAYMDYSIPYTVDPISLFVKKGESFPFDGWSELVGKKGVVTKGDSYGKEFDNYIADELNVVVAETPTEAFALVLSGEADYFVYALYAGEKAMKSDPDLGVEVLPNHVCAEDFYMTISKKSKLVSYLPRINESLQELVDNGAVDQLIEQHKNN